MTESKPLRILSEREPTPDENLWLDMRAEAVKATPGRVSDALARLLTLSTAMAGGAIGVMKDDVSVPWGRAGAAAMFFAALVAAAVGSLPRTAVLPAFPAADIRAAVHRAVGFKDRCATVSVIFLSLGVLAAIVGVVARVLCPLPK